MDAKVQAAATGKLHDEAAFADMAQWLSGGTLTPARSGHLTRFALPLGVKRALDYANFFETRHPGLAELKRDQAARFGRCLSHVTSDDRNGAIRELRSLAALEGRIRDEIARA